MPSTLHKGQKQKCASFRSSLPTYAAAAQKYAAGHLLLSASFATVRGRWRTDMRSMYVRPAADEPALTLPRIHPGDAQVTRLTG